MNTINELFSLTFEIENGASWTSIFTFSIFLIITFLISLKILTKGRKLMATHKTCGYILRTISFFINAFLFLVSLLSSVYFLSTDTYAIKDEELTVIPRSYDVRKFTKNEVKDIKVTKDDDTCLLALNIQSNKYDYTYEIEINNPEIYNKISDCKDTR